MPNSLQSSVIASPASRRATNCSLSSITEHSVQAITSSLPEGGSVTHVFGTKCHLCLRSLTSLSVTYGWLFLLFFGGTDCHKNVMDCLRRRPSCSPARCSAAFARPSQLLMSPRLKLVFEARDEADGSRL